MDNSQMTFDTSSQQATWARGEAVAAQLKAQGSMPQNPERFNDMTIQNTGEGKFLSGAAVEQQMQAQGSIGFDRAQLRNDISNDKLAADGKHAALAKHAPEMKNVVAELRQGITGEGSHAKAVSQGKPQGREL